MLQDQRHLLLIEVALAIMRLTVSINLQPLHAPHY